ncbi:MAG: L-serine ammonia-lyase [Simkania sp.]|nr:L-serine ammonia-lyase [Simkania sp.]
MVVSVFELFSIGIGPSSSHTVGPMRAARRFVEQLQEEGKLDLVGSLTIELFGSLAMTGHGHATDIALLLGLEGSAPEEIDPENVESCIANITETGFIKLLSRKQIPFSKEKDLLFLKGKRLAFHSNAMRFKALDVRKRELMTEVFYSVGGGFIVRHDEIYQSANPSTDHHLPYPFKTAKELLAHCIREDKSIWDIVMANELIWRQEDEIRRGILRIWNVMQACVTRGCLQEGILPGGLNVKRRAAGLYRSLTLQGDLHNDPSQILDWISLFALAVNEENAVGGRVVTAPTNGASGVIPAVLHYYMKFTSKPSEEGIIRFFLTATAIGILYKEGASLSAAEMGCQGEVGVACSMAAAGLAAALGATTLQIENAAEIGMEHNLGLTCDPVGGLVQIPCIERNTMGAIKAVNACRLAMHGDGDHRVSLDEVIIAMRHTGEDMKSLYKETSSGGLAAHVSVAITEC